MRRVLGLILAGVAGFFLCTALLLWTYAPGKVYVTPLNVDSTSHLDGIGRVLPTGGSGPIKAVNRTVADARSSDDEVVVFDTFTCLMTGTDGPDCVDDKDPQKRLISATTERFAAGRVSAMAVNDAKYTDQSNGPMSGLVNKWPFHVEQKTYPYWDGTVGKAVDATFKGVENLEGLDTYHFIVTIPETATDIAKGVKGSYKDTKQMWVDPLTGSPVKQTESQVRKLEDGTVVLDIDLGFTADQVSQSVADAKANGAKLAMISKGPWFCLVIGLLAVAGAAFALVRGRRQEDEVLDETYAGGVDQLSSGEALALPEGYGDSWSRRRSDLNKG